MISHLLTRPKRHQTGKKIGVDPDVIPPEPEDPRKPIEDPEVAASLDLVKRALKKSGYPENEIDPLLNSLWDGVDPNPKAPERLTTDSETGDATNKCVEKVLSYASDDGIPCGTTTNGRRCKIQEIY